ncbi:hypothetical protein ABIB73_003834 [Bradyrhizobium sp. F1.4.3]
MMNRKHAIVTFWRTPASELIVSSAGDFLLEMFGGTASDGSWLLDLRAA